MMRPQRREVRLRWPVLVSGLLHVLAVFGLNLLQAPVGRLHLPQENPPIRIFLSYTDQVDESLKAEVFPEISGPGQKSDGLKTPLVPESEASVAPNADRVIQPSTVQVSEAPKPPDPRPPADIRSESIPSISPSRPTDTGRRQDTPPKRIPVTRPQVHPPVPKQPEADQFARLPTPTERMLQDAPDQDHQHDPSPGRSPVEAGSGFGRQFGRVPLLSGSDLDKYAKLPASEQSRSFRPLSGLDTVISLDTKDIRYLAYFAHIKHKIEQAWSYPAEAVAGHVHGRLLLLFVLQRGGQVKKVEIVRSSGSKVLDKEAWDAVVTAGPFDPFPPQIPQEELHIRARFSYTLEAAQRQTTVH